jgi:hypothetical protein
MKVDRIFLKAAEIMDDSCEYGCCRAIGMAIEELSRNCHGWAAQDKFSSLFKRITSNGYWFPRYDHDAQLFLSGERARIAREQRVYALLIAANVFKGEQV